MHYFNVTYSAKVFIAKTDTTYVCSISFDFKIFAHILPQNICTF